MYIYFMYINIIRVNASCIFMVLCQIKLLILCLTLLNNNSAFVYAFYSILYFCYLDCVVLCLVISLVK